jgi:RNAse (barnase) inhibitor barstar
MNDWVNLTEIIPGLEKGQWLHVVNSPLLPLENILSENGFSVYVIDGSEITDSGSFFLQVKSVFRFPEYFHGSWAAWDDCLGEFGSLLKEKTAIIWDCADKTFFSDAKTFIQAFFDLYNLALTAGDIDQPSPHQVELFLVGNSAGFKNTLDLS